MDFVTFANMDGMNNWPVDPSSDLTIKIIYVKRSVQF